MKIAYLPVTIAIILILFFSLGTALNAQEDHGTQKTEPKNQKHPVTDQSTPLETQVKHIFQNKCKTCHTFDDSDGDPYGVFGANGIPEAEKIPAVLDRTSREAGKKGRMPPKAGDPLTEKEKQTIKDWAGSLQASR